MCIYLRAVYTERRGDGDTYWSARVPLLLHSCLRYSLVGLRFKLGLLGARYLSLLWFLLSHTPSFTSRIYSVVRLFMPSFFSLLLTSSCHDIFKPLVILRSPCTRALATALVPLLFFGTSRVTRQHIHGRICYCRHTNLRIRPAKLCAGSIRIIFVGWVGVGGWDVFGFGLVFFSKQFLNFKCLAHGP